MANFKTASINLNKIDKTKLFEGKTGKFLNIIIWENSEADQYGNDFAIQQSSSKEDREAGIKMPYLGNGKNHGAGATKAAASTKDDGGDDLPF